MSGSPGLMDGSERDSSYRYRLELARAVVEELRKDSDGVRAKALEALPGIRANSKGDALDWMDEWSSLLAGPVEELEAMLLRQDEHGATMRLLSPFENVLSFEQHQQIARAVFGPDGGSFS